ncbi:cytochrome c-550 PedF [Noviherbaspirillum galbum]|uniref:Cytochrome c-550 PedF n=1 Tax=Noviherbaspirillum galbum TaxID=2709383 RepID=A0A6B3STA1_9BURK|nr:cytochrome c-550 PedF [Noviherbaspirillum galbum]NEX63894.1 cytochrome c-550 PedF [Noviherbaspirillum galbum]
MKTLLTHALAAAIVAGTAFYTATAAAHGDVTPQAVDTKGLPQLGDQWREENPFSGNKDAIRIGSSAYNQNCARCHGIEAISGGIAPDLRMLDRDCVKLANESKKKACYKDVDKYFLSSVRNGKVRNGAVYMPKFEGILSQEAFWSVKSYLETRREVK